MIYCLNPDCQAPLNSDEDSVCQSCGTPLVSRLRGRYRLLRLIGDGGFGRTFLAEDGDKMQEYCVVKQFNPKVQGTRALHKASQMFEQEARQLQQLGEHPQIPALYAYFEQDKCLYMVQQFIGGPTLQQELKQQGNFSEQKIWEVLADLLPVLSYIHAYQVIHRDIKPDNIVRRQQDSLLVLIDFGVAKSLTEAALAQTSTVVGSMGYAPLEQVKSGQILPASDLYSLGVTCFQLLSNTDPQELWSEHGYSWVANWLQYCPTLTDEELIRILTKLLQKDIQQRYQSADEVLQDLSSIGRFALPPSGPLSGPLTGPLGGISPGVGTPEPLSSSLTGSASSGLTDSPLTTPLTGPLSQPHSSPVVQSVSSGHTMLEAETIPAEPTSPRSAPWFKNRFLVGGAALLLLGVVGYGALQFGRPVSTSAALNEKITLARTLTGHMGEVNAVAITPDSQTLVSGSDDATLKLWQLNTGQELRSLSGHKDWIYSLAISPDGQTLVSGSKDRTIGVWNLTTGQELHNLKGHIDFVNGVAISPNGSAIASGSYDRTIKLWNLNTGELLGTLRGHNGNVFSVTFSPDGQTLASCSYDKTIKLWDPQTQQQIRTLRGHFSDVNALAFTPNGQFLVSGSDDRTVRVWDWQIGKDVRSLTGHSGTVFTVAVSPDGKTIASGSQDKTIKLWDLETGQAIRTLTGHLDSVFGVTFSPDGKTLASASKDRTVKIWQVPQ